MSDVTPDAGRRIAQPLELPCGAVLPNRLAKVSMTEGVADAQLRPTAAHVALYRKWAEGGAGLLLTGNVMIDRRVLERPGNVALDPAPPDAETRQRLKAWAQAGTCAGNHLWMQINHPGRQSPWYVAAQPLSPSEVQLKVLATFRKPRALTEPEILDFIDRWARVAATARETGFTGVQIHAAHGYLLSQFLSPLTNRRTDAWGGALENRARMLLETVSAVRKAVGPDFPISIKLNSADFQKGGFTREECVQVVQWLNEKTVDLLEISGGTYEQPRLLSNSGDVESAVGTAAGTPKAASTQRREAYFMEYAADIRRIARMPVMVTGGFRTLAGMEAALASGGTDMIGLARPLCVQTDGPRQLLSGAVDHLEAYENRLDFGPGVLGPASSIRSIKSMNTFGQLGWFCLQIMHMAHGRPYALGLGGFGALMRYMTNEYRTAWRLRGARRQQKQERAAG
ncbi:MAG: NADH:flavin oxidoreductase/NADH oxidase family protein [Nevskiaceae bacterium]|nr:MAG: NADH:flavin oxidoreductase/NADH oxidase family protein [Nevskiaceae bacterium]TBR74261.1 MAG: NADH:flavin oxidoreductase/NADH oxidase family protein [Nevskiaceae bacterium]